MRNKNRKIIDEKKITTNINQYHRLILLLSRHLHVNWFMIHAFRQEVLQTNPLQILKDVCLSIWEIIYLIIIIKKGKKWRENGKKRKEKELLVKYYEISEILGEMYWNFLLKFDLNWWLFILLIQWNVFEWWKFIEAMLKIFSCIYWKTTTITKNTILCNECCCN